MEEREAETVTKEQVYRDQMKALGIYHEIHEPEIKTLAKIERQITRAEKAWSDTAPPDGKPRFLDPHFAIIQRLRSEALQHKEALGITAKALARLTSGTAAAPEPKDLITAKLDAIAERVAGYDAAPFAGIPAADEAAEISDQMDEELRRAVHEDMG